MASMIDDSSGSTGPQHSMLGDSIAPDPLEEVTRPRFRAFQPALTQGDEEENAAVAAEVDDDAKDLVGEMNKYLPLAAQLTMG